jgi:hypothetical protein
VNMLAMILARRIQAGRVGLMLCLIGAGSLAAGCSGGPPPATVKLTGAQITMLTATTKGPWVAYALAHNAAETLVARCMHAHGLTYDHPDFERAAVAATMATQVPGVPQASISLAARQADGYGFYSKAVQQAAHPDAQNQLDPGEKYIASLPAAEKQHYELILRGPLNRRVTVTIPGGGTAQIEAGGCVAAARRQVYGSLANFLLATTGWGELQGQLNGAVQADPAFPAVLAKWSACMTAHGYKYTNPEGLWNRLGTRIDHSPTPAHHALEIRTAVQDYRCSQAVKLIATIRALQAHHARYVSQALAGNVARVTQVFANALKVARALHVTG